MTLHYGSFSRCKIVLESKICWTKFFLSVTPHKLFLISHMKKCCMDKCQSDKCHLVFICLVKFICKIPDLLPPSGRFWWGLLLLFLVVLVTGGRQSQLLLCQTVVQLEGKFRVEFDN